VILQKKFRGVFQVFEEIIVLSPHTLNVETCSSYQRQPFFISETNYPRMEMRESVNVEEGKNKAVPSDGVVFNRIRKA